MGDRAVDCARLESVCTARYQGFESPPIRQRLNEQGRVLHLALFVSLNGDSNEVRPVGRVTGKG